MYDDYHNFIKEAFNSPQIVMSDTDSFLLFCTGIESLESIVEKHKDRFDLSNLNETHPMRNLDNCKTLGKWKVPSRTL